MNPLVFRSLILKGAVNLAAVAMGFYLYKRYEKNRRQLIGMTAGMVAGHKLGALAGSAVAGPMGAMAGMTVGCLSGCLLGGDLAKKRDEDCCEAPESKQVPQKLKIRK